MTPKVKKEKWVDVSKEIEWKWREDGVLEIRHNGICWGHLAFPNDGRWEFFWVGHIKYKEEVKDRELHIFKEKVEVS